MKCIKLLLLIAFPLLFYYCVEPLELPEEQYDPCRWTDCDTNSTNMELERMALWAAPIPNDGITMSVGPIFREGNNIYVNYYGGKNQIESLFLGTGESVWTWDDLSNFRNIDDVFFHPEKSTLLLHRSERMVTIDALTGLTTGVSIQREGDAITEGHIVGDDYYHVRYHWFYEGEKYVVRCNIDALEDCDTIYSVDPAQHDSDWMFVEGFQDWVNPFTGDQHLLFIHQGVTPAICDVVNYNLSKDTVEWIAYKAAEGRNGSSVRTFLADNKMLLITGGAITCLDLTNAAILWQTEAEDGSYFNHLDPPLYIASDNSLILMKDRPLEESKMVKIDVANGSVLLERDRLDYQKSSFFTHLGDVIFSFVQGSVVDNRLILINKNDLTEDKSIKTKLSLEGPVEIYLEDSLFISSSPDSIYAFDLNKIINR